VEVERLAAMFAAEEAPAESVAGGEIWGPGSKWGDGDGEGDREAARGVTASDAGPEKLLKGEELRRLAVVPVGSSLSSSCFILLSSSKRLRPRTLLREMARFAMS